MQNSTQKMKKNSEIHQFIREKNADDFWLKFWDLSGAKVCTSCRSRQALSNEYVLVEIGVDTAENEPLKILVSFLNP